MPEGLTDLEAICIIFAILFLAELGSIVWELSGIKSELRKKNKK